MNRRVLLIVVCSYVCLFSSAFSQEKRGDFYFVQITDPQFGFFTDNESFDQEVEIYQKAIEKINALSPEFVVITGDFVNKKHDPEQNKAFIELTKTFKTTIPVYLIPGNHDIGQNPTSQDMEKYHALYGEDRFCFEHRKALFIGLNSGFMKSAETVSEEKEQFEWLSRQLDHYPDASPVIIFTHYPFFIKDVDEEEKYSNLSIDMRKKYFDLFARKNVTAVFAGHYHNNGYGEYRGIPMVTTSALGKPLSKAPSGIRVISISGGEVEHTYYAVDDIPDKL